MARIYLLCPSTDRRLDTGMTLSRSAFSAYVPRNARSFCPHCHRTHQWTKDGMLLQDDEPATDAKR